jgi:Tol biopolymer transport system component
MKHSGIALILTLLVNCAIFGQTAPIDYLGQKAPGTTPKKFAPDVFKINEWGPVFSPDGTELFYTWQNPNGSQDYHINYMKKTAGVWSQPVKAPFCDKNGRPDIEPNFTPDGKRLYFDSERNGGFGKADIWYVEKTAAGWSEAFNAGEGINTSLNDNMPSFAPDGTLYFCSDRNNDEWDIDIYYAKLAGGKYLKPVKIDAINTRTWDAHPTVLGDKLFFTSVRSEGVGKGDIYFSIITGDTYGKPQPMPAVFNSNRSEWGLVLSPDKKYFFFFHQEDGLYWVDVKALAGSNPK